MAGTITALSNSSAAQRDREELRAARFAMRLSLMIGVLMLVGKTAAYRMTGSAAILSDFAESVVHVVAVAFAAFSLRLSTKPAAPTFLYGYERITFFSAGFEGAMIVLAAVWILVATIEKWMAGLKLEHLGSGTLLLLGAGVLNAGLGWYLLQVGKRSHSLILEADGKHVLTDSLTSFGVVAGLGLVMLTGWKPFDPLLAIVVAANILWSGGRLAWRSAVGLARLLRSGSRKADSRKAGCDLLRPRSALPWRAFSDYGLPADYRSPLAISARHPGRRSAPRGNHSRRAPPRRTGQARRSDHAPGIAGRSRSRSLPGTLHRATGVASYAGSES